MTVRDTDRGYAALLKRVGTMRRPQISVGVHAAEGARTKNGGVTVLDVATWAEFGLGQPERSWLRAWFDNYRSKAAADLRKIMKAALKGAAPLGTSLERAGQRFVGLVQLRIAQGIAPANSPVTIARKGSSTPLIDTGVFRSSITYTVRLGPR